jgi:hypothetical protein
MGSLSKIDFPNQPAQEKPSTAAGAYLCRRFGLDPLIAELIASLAGLGPDRRAA